MPGTFAGIQIASRALTAYQEAIDVVGHNVANVSTPGYTRQSGALVATPPDGGQGESFTGVSGQIGTGVELKSVTRVTDQFLDKRLLVAQGDLGQSNQMRDSLQRIQNVFQEPGGSGLSTQLDALFNSFQQLSQSPEDTSTRFIVRSQADTVTRQFNQLSSQLSQIDGDFAKNLADSIKSANDIAGLVADLNAKIQNSVAVGEHPNDLEDRRDELVRQLGTLVGADATAEVDSNGKETGNLNVNVGGYALVRGNVVNALPQTTGSVAGLPAFISGSDAYPIRAGEAAGIIKARSLLAGYKSDLDTLARAVISTVNAQHQAGYGLDGVTGRSFFAGTDAATIVVDPVIATNLDAIAAASVPAAGQPVAVGNGDNARAIADLANAPAVGSFTLGQFYSSRIVQVGQDARRFETDATNQDQQLRQIQTLRGSVSGVSMDEELTKMLQYQRSYQAAARLMSTMDDMLDRLINYIGLP